MASTISPILLHRAGESWYGYSPQQMGVAIALEPHTVAAQGTTTGALCTLLYTWCRASDDGEGAVLIADEALDVQPTARMQLRKHR